MNIQTVQLYASPKYQKKRENFCDTLVLFMEGEDNVEG